ncbi:hypothetical protein [Streptomyces soliscabiei]|uniref:hypothetical protein n=1 Tax=Streptomyces soliscabiei TaxID=588897 RepID=UPI0029BB52EE|nr:hypothetical protein [Streptomyces sp. NY05-11A]MDX2683372.1 hypothetical protein [Streptomyces sp. NY05-11A]
MTTADSPALAAPAPAPAPAPVRTRHEARTRPTARTPRRPHRRITLPTRQESPV